MNKFIRHSILFLLITLLVYLVCLFLWGSFLPGYFNKNMKYKLGYYGFMHTRLREAEKQKNVDILVLGSSHAYKGFDPRIFNQQGIRLFNLGSSNQSPQQSKILLKKYLPMIQPKLVLIEVYPEVFEMDGVESAVDILSNTPYLTDAWEHAREVNHLIGYNTFVYACLRHVFSSDKNHTEPRIIDEDTYISGGYVEHKLITQIDTINYPKQLWKWRKEQLVALNQIVEMLQGGGKKYPFLLVQAPITKKMEASYTNTRELENQLKKLGPYYHQEIRNLNDTFDFYDPHHLNQHGVQKFNLQFISDMNNFFRKNQIEVKPNNSFH